MLTRRQLLAAVGPVFFVFGGCGGSRPLAPSSEETSSEETESGIERGEFGEPDRFTEQDEFISLFDGETLQGWHTNVPETDLGSGGRWRVRDGVLTGQQDPPGSGNGGLLMTNQKFGDFELLIDLAPDWGIDSGVFLRTNSRGQGFQVYVDYHNHGNIGSIATKPPPGEKRMFIRPYNIFAEGKPGPLTEFTTKPDGRDVAWDPGYLKYSATPQDWKAAWKIGRWNTLRIRCVGKYPRITTWINHTKIAEFDGATSPHPRYDREKMFQALGREGSIALQVHDGTKMWDKGDKCRWDNIKVKPL